MTTYRIKPLEWKPFKSGANEGVEAVTMFWRYHAWTTAGANPRWMHAIDWHPCDSIEDGKAKCEAHWHENLLRALEPA